MKAAIVTDPEGRTFLLHTDHEVERRGAVIGRVDLELNGEWSYTATSGSRTFGFGTAAQAAWAGPRWVN